jgi:hypothetical protein
MQSPSFIPPLEEKKYMKEGVQHADVHCKTNTKLLIGKGWPPKNGRKASSAVKPQQITA